MRRIAMSGFVWNETSGQAVFDLAREPLLVADTQGNILLANSAARGDEDLSVEDWGSATVFSALGTDAAGWGMSLAFGQGHTTEFDSTVSQALHRKFGNWQATPVSEDHFVVSFGQGAETDGQSALVIQALKLKSQYLSEAQKAQTDQLTGMANRRTFETALTEAMNQNRESGRVFSLIMIDVDKFKSINDTYGHMKGDEVLIGLAGIYKSSVRGDDSAHRIGGEEFAILLPSANRHTAEDVAERLRLRVESGPIADLPVTISLGIVTCEGGFWTQSTLIDAGDQALYASKKNGRNRWTHFADMPTGEQVA
ncbi:MAG: GGDEF domain-containing protein [Chthonomonadaceae bacterium]|nr:GGDEF domain-containing protein [Chthonomonadaceae bacterium]